MEHAYVLTMTAVCAKSKITSCVLHFRRICIQECEPWKPHAKGRECYHHCHQVRILQPIAFQTALALEYCKVMQHCCNLFTSTRLTATWLSNGTQHTYHICQPLGSPAEPYQLTVGHIYARMIICLRSSCQLVQVFNKGHRHLEWWRGTLSMQHYESQAD